MKRKGRPPKEGICSDANFEPDTGKDLYVALAIAESIRAWMKELNLKSTSKYHGRFPNVGAPPGPPSRSGTRSRRSDPSHEA
jgi:hypothetical protein